jgi:hypothetical protein
VIHRRFMLSSTSKKGERLPTVPTAVREARAAQCLGREQPTSLQARGLPDAFVHGSSLEPAAPAALQA